MKHMLVYEVKYIRSCSGRTSEAYAGAVVANCLQNQDLLPASIKGVSAHNAPFKTEQNLTNQENWLAGGEEDDK
jgi:hypothetical protein